MSAMRLECGKVNTSTCTFVLSVLVSEVFSFLSETLAGKVDSTYGCYFVPAFSGLFCPYWQNDARG